MFDGFVKILNSTCSKVLFGLTLLSIAANAYTKDLPVQGNFSSGSDPIKNAKVELFEDRPATFQTDKAGNLNGTLLNALPDALSNDVSNPFPNPTDEYSKFKLAPPAINNGKLDFGNVK